MGDRGFRATPTGADSRRLTRDQRVTAPRQLAPVNAAFSASEQEVARASALVEACQAAIAEGRGAATHEGRIIDAASLRMAQVILRRHEMAGSMPRA